MPIYLVVGRDVSGNPRCYQKVTAATEVDALAAATGTGFTGLTKSIFQYFDSDIDADIAALLAKFNGSTDLGDVTVLALPALPAGSNNIGEVTTIPTGSPNYANGQVATSTSAATLLAARATRRKVKFKNTDGSITVYIGAATVSAANGYPLLAGAEVELTITTLIQAIAASGTPSIAYIEEYD